MGSQELLLEVSGLTVEFSRGRRRPLRAVDGVSFTVAPRQTLGLVGESGSGKTTIGRAILGLTAVQDGSVAFAGEDITHAPYRRRRALSAELQAIFQDPYSSLNPVRTVGETLAETVRVERRSRPEVRARVLEMLERVGLPREAADRYPVHFSGGQRQRIAIARALMAHPRLVVCDEPTSALDLSVQAHVLNLLHQLQSDFDLSYVFISHDLAVIRHLSHQIVVLYAGRIMEQGNVEEICERPRHPYTRALLEAAPTPDPEVQRERRAARVRIRGDAPRASGEGCPFAPRCPQAIARCQTTQPPLEKSHAGTLIACHRWRELDPGSAAVIKRA